MRVGKRATSAKSLPVIALNHGSALRLPAELGFQGRASRSTFHEYIKSLRKRGIPVRPGEIGFAPITLMVT
jgi:hypothetical protein